MEIKELMSSLNTQFEEFKKANDEGRDDMVKNLETAMSEKQTQIDELKTSMARATLADTIDEVKEISTHSKAFDEYARKGIETGVLEYKAMNTGSPVDGGYLVPEIIQNGVMELLRELSPMRQVSNVMSLSGTGSFTKNAQTLNAIGGWIGETAPRANTAGQQFDQITIPTFEVYANPQVTLAMLEDANINLETFLAQDVAGAIASLENTAFTVGTGVAQPKGLSGFVGVGAWDSIKTVAVAGTGAVTGDELYGVVYDVMTQYRAGASWMMDRNTLEKVRILKDGNGRYLFERGQLDDPSIAGTLLGYPVIENEDCADMATGTNPIYFGDFSKGYQIVDRVGMSTLRNPYKNPGFVEFYTRKRVGGGLLDGNALRAVQMA